MTNNEKPDFLDWIGMRQFRDFDFTTSRPLGVVVGGLIGLVVIALLIIAFAALLRLTGALIGFPSTSGTTDIRGIGFLLAALLAAPFVVWRAIIAQKQTGIAEQGLITDRINKAVEGLGAEKTVKSGGEETTQPNIEVRIGAIYSLERIAQDSDRDHIQIMEILCAYIRLNAPQNVVGTDGSTIYKKNHTIGHTNNNHSNWATFAATNKTGMGQGVSA